MQPQDVKNVLLYSALNGGHLTLVECNDGSFLVLRDDRPVPGYRWESHQLEVAVKAYRDLSAQLKGKSN